MSKAQGYAIGLEARGFVAEADELRRLEAENESFRIGVHHLRDNNVALRAARDELLEALKAASNYIDTLGGVSQSYRQLIQKHGAAS